MGLSSFKITTMTPLSMKTYPALLCGIFLFLILETKSEWTANENITNTTAAEQPTTGHHSVTPAHTGESVAEVIANTSLHNTPSPNVVNTNSMTTTTSNDHPGLPHNSTDKTTTASEEQFAHNGSVSGTEKPPHTETASTSPLTAHPSEVPTTAASPTEVKSTEQKSTLPPKNPTTSTTAPETPALTTGSAPTSNNSTTSSPKNNTSLATTASATQTTFLAISGKPNITNREFNQSTPTTVMPSSILVNATNGTTLVIHKQTTQNTRTFITTTAHPLTSQSTTGTSISTTAFSNKSITEISSTVFPTLHNTTNATEGIWIPVITKKFSTSKPKSTTVTESPQSTDAQPCNCIGVAKQCLIVIAALAAVAIIFIISTIVLCIKQSTRKYRVRRHQQGTEMMCISSLLPETSNHHRHNYTRQRSPVPNGVLVIHNCGDSDDDVGDNLTLSSFLPDNDRYV